MVITGHEHLNSRKVSNSSVAAAIRKSPYKPYGKPKVTTGFPCTSVIICNNGFHRTYISDLEQGARKPSLLLLEKLAAPLGVTASALIADPE